MDQKLGISGHIANLFQAAYITPLLALFIFIAGIFSIFMTPREEEPQINVTMADVIISFPGASPKNVEQMVSIPAEQVLSQITGIEHVTSVSRVGLSIITVQFKVGIPRTEALVQLYDTVNSHADWLPKGLGVMSPIIKPKGIDDVPIVSLTLFSKKTVPFGQELDRSYELEKVANRIEVDLKRVKGTKEVTTIGGPGRAIKVEIDPQKLIILGFTIQEVQNILVSVNSSMSVGELLSGEQAIMVESGPFLKNANDVGDIVIGVRDGTAVFLKEVATVLEGPIQTRRIVSHVYKDSITKQLIETPAVTVAITKKTGENAIDIAKQINRSILQLKAHSIPQDVEIEVTRNYGQTANEKANQLIHKLLFATISVIILVSVSLGKREAVVVGTAVILTLSATLFASMAYGFTINRVSLFALIFSIGILVDDAIVVVENIHRHQQLNPNKHLKEIIPFAVDEVGSPTILATLTVIASLLPMTFVSGLMGPYMSPIPINASMGMFISLMVAFVITPWMSYKLFTNYHNTTNRFDISKWLLPKFNNIFKLFFDEQNGHKNRLKLNLYILIAITVSILLPATGLVVLKMLPFDNKSEFQVILDMPAGTRVEKTFRVLKEIGKELNKLPELDNYQIYAGTTAPISFNGLVRQYYLRQDQSVGDLQVNLISKNDRKEKSHIIATKIRPLLDPIAKQYLGNIKVVEVPPGPPVLAPIVAEVYSSNDTDRLKVAHEIRKIFEQTKGIVDVDDSSIAKSVKKLLIIDRNKASLMGISQKTIVNTLKAGLSGEDITYVYDESKYPAAVAIRLPENEQSTLSSLLGLTIRNAQKDLISLDNFIRIIETEREQLIYHKDLLPVNYVIADTSGKIDSPLYGLFSTNHKINKIKDLHGNKIKKYFINQPSDPHQTISMKWDGEWQITYETFRDLLIAFAMGLILIYLLLVSQSGSYITPIIIMLPIPLTIIGVMPGHALLRAQFTATSMIGMIALAGIIVRNSILLVDFANIQIKQGVPLKSALINSVVIRAQPIILTGLSAILGALFILEDPIFNGLAISLIFGIFVATVLTLIIIPVFYFSIYSLKDIYVA
jgi:multidrug efflux pump subunit AcrB